MEYFAGLDVSMEETHVCVVEDANRTQDNRRRLGERAAR